MDLEETARQEEARMIGIIADAIGDAAVVHYTTPVEMMKKVVVELANRGWMTEDESATETIVPEADGPVPVEFSSNMSVVKDTLSKTVLVFGKHKSKNFLKIAQEDPSYLVWILQNIKKCSYPQAKDFREWINKHFEIKKFNKSDAGMLVRLEDKIILTGTLKGYFAETFEEKSSGATSSSPRPNTVMERARVPDVERDELATNVKELLGLLRSSQR